MADAAEVPLLVALNNQVAIVQQGLLPVLVFDCSVEEVHKRESQITEFETENGETVSDHIVIKPFQLHIQGIVTDAPLNVLASLGVAAVTTAIASQVSKPGVLGQNAAAIAALPLIPNPFSPSSSAYRALLDLQFAKLPFSVVTTLFEYKNMVVKSLSVPRNAQKGNAIFFELDLVQLLLVTPITVNLAQFAEADLSANQANKGAQGPIQPPAAFLNGINGGTSAAASLVGG